jgi:hypothetical protein
LQHLNWGVEETLILLRLAKDTRALPNLKAYEQCASWHPGGSDTSFSTLMPAASAKAHWLRCCARNSSFVGSADGSTHAWALHLDIRSFFVRINKQFLLAQGLRGA